MGTIVSGHSRVPVQLYVTTCVTYGGIFTNDTMNKLRGATQRNKNRVGTIVSGNKITVGTIVSGNKRGAIIVNK